MQLEDPKKWLIEDGVSTGQVRRLLWAVSPLLSLSLGNWAAQGPQIPKPKTQEENLY